jgi:hypothetical protein
VAAGGLPSGVSAEGRCDPFGVDRLNSQPHLIHHFPENQFLSDLVMSKKKTHRRAKRRVRLSKEARALAQFLKHNPAMPFFVGNPSTVFLLELEKAGKIKLRRRKCRGLERLEVCH